MFVDKARATGNPTKNWADMEEDDDDKTVTSGGSEKNNQKMREISVKWCFNGMTDNKTVKAALIDILTTIMQVHNEDIIITDHNAREFEFNEDIDEEKQRKSLHKEGKFPIHKATAKGESRLNRWFATHKIRTTLSLSTIKGHFLIRDKMQHARAYMTLHQFALNKWDIAHLGFLQGYNVMHVSKHHTKLRLMKETQSVSDKTPIFEVANSRVRSGQGQGPYHCTQAYEIQCAREDASKMTKIMQTGIFRTTMAFVPYAYKKYKPEAFLKAIHLQNKNLTETWVIKIQGFTAEAMEHCQPTLQNQQGVSTITPTPRGTDIGEWKILIRRQDLANYYQWLGTHMKQITDSIPSQIQPPDNYPAYSINSQPPQSYQDTDEDEVSFGTMFSNAMTELSAQSQTEYAIPKVLFTYSKDTTEKTSERNQTESTYVSDLSSNKEPQSHNPPPTYANATTNNTTTTNHYPPSNPYQKHHQTIPAYYPGHYGNHNAQTQPPAHTSRQPDNNIEAATTLQTEIETLKSANREAIQHLQEQTKQHEERMANELQKQTNQIEHLQANATRMEQLILRLLEQQTIGESHPTPSSNKRPNTMHTPTKQRKEDPENHPGVDFGSQYRDND